MENNWLNLIRLLKLILIFIEMPYHLRKKTKKINKLLPQRYNEFDDITLIN